VLIESVATDQCRQAVVNLSFLRLKLNLQYRAICCRFVRTTSRTTSCATSWHGCRIFVVGFRFFCGLVVQLTVNLLHSLLYSMSTTNRSMWSVGLNLSTTVRRYISDGTYQNDRALYSVQIVFEARLYSTHFNAQM